MLQAQICVLTGVEEFTDAAGTSAQPPAAVQNSYEIKEQ